jgi:tetratricopeptide (TPR) repeat protein
LLHAQPSGPLTEGAAGLSSVAASELDKSALAASSNLTSASAQPRTLASMASQLEPIVKVLTGVLNQYRKSGNRDGESSTLCALGNSYNSFGQQQKAVEYFQQALTISRETGDRKMEANALSRIGDVYHGWGFPDMAVRFYHDALQIHAQTGDKLGKAVVLNNLGVIYLAQSNKKKSLEYLNQALASYHDAGDRHAETLTLINIAASENFLAHDAQKAISLLQHAINELEPFNDRTNEADAYEMLGVVWAGLHKQETAEMNFERALELYRSVGDAHGEASVQRHLKNFESHDLASVR